MWRLSLSIVKLQPTLLDGARGDLPLTQIGTQLVMTAPSHCRRLASPVNGHPAFVGSPTSERWGLHVHTSFRHTAVTKQCVPYLNLKASPADFRCPLAGNNTCRNKNEYTLTSYTLAAPPCHIVSQHLCCNPSNKARNAQQNSIPQRGSTPRWQTMCTLEP